MKHIKAKDILVKKYKDDFKVYVKQLFFYKEATNICFDTLYKALCYVRTMTNEDIFGEEKISIQF